MEFHIENDLLAFLFICYGTISMIYTTACVFNKIFRNEKKRTQVT